MKLSRRNTASAAPDARGAVEPWVAPPTRAALVTGATKIGMWVLVGCGPVALLTAAAIPHDRTAVTAAAPVPASAIGPTGWAQLYVATYLRAGSGDTTLQAFYPDAPAIIGASGRRQATRTVTVGAVEVRRGYWSVTVAADETATTNSGPKPLGAHYYVVAVLALGGPETGGTKPVGTPPAYVAAALPAEIAAPASGSAPELGYNATNPVVGGPLADTVSQFLAAYLTGNGDLGRYLTPGKVITAIQPAPYQQVTASTILSATDLPSGGTVPGDGTMIRVLVTADAVDAAGQHWPLSYALTLTARAGRWEVTMLAGAPDLAGSPAATTAPSSGAPQDAPPSAAPSSPAPDPAATGSPGPSSTH